ncbi:hypothetical protein HID58_055473 [Brassica napus]|uniref:Replication protein A 70 kDa DNA-binding subunit B/D first OB fold domain-containing protein n=1 Tax=Brassica napus TaxID=3708 RepID=A0ABQ8AKH0_BRANA|nr:hypothetical protein HID58_055473 [Brassica napus]
MNFISDLKSKNVIRLWKQYLTGGGETIEMVFVYAKGYKIHESIKMDLVSQIHTLLRQGCSKLLFNFFLAPSCINREFQ